MRLTATSLVIFAACGATVRPAVPPAPHEGGSFVLTNVRVFDGEHTFEHRNVVVRDGRIASLGAEPPPSDLSVLDGTGRTVFPGLIDAHAHVQTEVGLRNALRFGVTTLLDMFTRVEFMQAHRAQRDRLTRTDLADLYSAGNPITSPGGMGTQFGIPFATIEGPEEASAFVRARLAEGSAYIKILFEPEAGIVTTIPRQRRSPRRFAPRTSKAR